MIRRAFLATLTSLAFAAPLAAEDKVFYTPGLAETAMENGDIVFLDFWASWCSTCAAQARIIGKLRSENAEYDANINFIVVDWDEYGTGELSRSMNIPRRSTLVVMDGTTEIGRIVAGTSEADIKALMDKALMAAKG